MKVQPWMMGGVLLTVGMNAYAQSSSSAPANAPVYMLHAHSESLYAHDLYRLNQKSLVEAEANAAKETSAENLWKSELVMLAWDSATKVGASERAEQARQYRDEINAYLDSQAAGIDGVWALDQVKFIVAHLAEPALNRLEYWGATAKDRAELAPLAALERRLLKQAVQSLGAGMHEAESKSPFDEAAYTRAFTANAEAEYYGTWANYLQAVAIDPTQEGSATARKKLLLSAAAALGKWADDKDDNGVNNQALLLRGKARSEAGQYELAAEDFSRAAESAASPVWLRYQARYQLIVARMRANDFSGASEELSAFRRALPKGDVNAQLSTEMLGFRLAWVEAASKPVGEQKSARAAAEGILSDVIQRDPRFRELVYKQLAEKISEAGMGDVTSCTPLEQLALAYTWSENEAGAAPESRARLSEAARMAQTVHDTAGISAADKLEATFLAAVTEGLLHNLLAAARFNTEFAELAPADSRAKPLLELALTQLGELRKAAASSGTSGDSNGGNSADVLKLQLRALTLATEKFQDLRWRFAQGRAREDLGDLDAAAKIFAAIPVGDINYFDARFRLIAIALARFNSLSIGGSSSDIHSAADDLFGACGQFFVLLENPPAQADKAAVEVARHYRVDIWLIETSVALQPSVRQPATALDCLAKLQALEETKNALSNAQETALFRYRIEAYQIGNQPEKALETLRQYAAAQGKEPMDVIHSLAYSTVDEVTRKEKTNPEEARQLAGFVVKLLDPLIAAAAKEPVQKETEYGYQKLQSDMMLRAGQYADAQALAAKLQSTRPDDIFNYMTEARVIFEHARATADAKLYAEAQDHFTRILPQVSNSGESFWECWLRILQAKEILGGTDAQTVIKQHLGDLHVAFGEKIGGTLYHAEFVRLLEKYGA